ncbi:hypothetical protein EYF80_027613 [Liparis tanakae]|uniref:Uncharacterized protein n=1 Tax=Liparis tanakae TaxID=230148 RepID=A0A4Z2HAT7_9TELE|nr:hypothetical protein EYF80_027613 [Liparis tanakae]
MNPRYSTSTSTAVVTNLCEPKIPDLRLHDRQDLPIEVLRENYCPDWTCELSLFIWPNFNWSSFQIDETRNTEFKCNIKSKIFFHRTQYEQEKTHFNEQLDELPI